MSNVAVNSNVLAWAIDRARTRYPLEWLNKKFPKIPEWISGESQPTLRQLETLAKTTATPLGFLLLDEPPEERLPVPHYRTIRDEAPTEPSPELIDTVHLMQRRQFWMKDFLIEQGNETLPYVNSASIGDSPILVARRMREALNFDMDWASHQSSWSEALRILRQAMFNVGILVVVNGVVENNTHRKLNPHEFRGFVLVDDYAPLVFVNNSDWKAAQMFTLAHELAHIFLGSSAAFDLRQLQPADEPVELSCNRIAAEFLVSATELSQVWPSVKNNANPFQDSARRFKVSEIVIARRTLDLGLISREEFFNFYDRYRDQERDATEQRQPGGDFYNNQNMRVGKRFFSAVVQAVREGNLLYSDAYKLTGLYGSTFDQYVEICGFGRV